MLSDINEPVEVLAVFKGATVFPKEILWNGRTYKITRVDMRHEVMQGSTLIHYFSVSDSANHFKLAFNTKSLQWRLEQVYSEG